MTRTFHAGGAHALDFSFSTIRGLGYSLFRRKWTVADYGSLITILGAAPAVWHLLRNAWREAAHWVRHLFMASVTIPARDPLNRHVSSWLLTHVIEPRANVRVFTARTEPGKGTDMGGDPRAAGLKKTRRAVQFVPHWTQRVFLHGGCVFLAARANDNLSAAFTADPVYDGVGGEELTISCLGRSAAPIRAFLQQCREWADQQTQFFVLVYARDRYGLAWQPKARTPIRRLDTVHFDEKIKEALLADVRTYLDERTRRRYRTRSMPYRRGYLFHGPPGTGKTSLTTALAGEFGLDLYEVKVPSVSSDADLEAMFAEIPPQCIVLLEDIDAVWTDRDRDRDRDREGTGSGSGSSTLAPPILDGSSMSSRSHSHSGSRGNCTLSGLLNVLDGVGSQEGRIVIMTTNKPELLDKALVRPGRVDMSVYLGNISPLSAEQMFLRMFAPNILDANVENGGEVIDAVTIARLAARFGDEVPDDTFTPSQLQGFFQSHLDSPFEAADAIAAWVKAELTKKMVSDREYDFVPNEKKLLVV